MGDCVLRSIRFFIPLVLLAVAACGTTEKTVVVTPPAGSTVVVPPNGQARVTPPSR